MPGDVDQLGVFGNVPEGQEGCKSGPQLRVNRDNPGLAPEMVAVWETVWEKHRPYT